MAWVNVCLPFKEGGLGVKRLDTWNQAAMLKHVWNLCSDRENSIWSSWVWTYLIKRRSFWELKCPGDCSWTWRKILNFREIARGKIKYPVGDGRTSRDRIVWAESPNGKFSIKSAWNSVRHRETVVGWHKLVWFKNLIPRHAIILWMAIRGKLYTQDKLVSMGIIQINRCVLCKEEEETLDHLFSSCPFTARIWSLLCDRCALPRSHRRWETNVEWLSRNFSDKSLLSLIVRLMFAAFVYSLWKERKMRMQSGKTRRLVQIYLEILEYVRTRTIYLRNFPRSSANIRLVEAWGLTDSICS